MEAAHPIWRPLGVPSVSQILVMPMADAVDLAALSREFGEAQMFATHRVVESHLWQRWVAGRPLRRYWWIGQSGGLPLDEGEPAAAEGALVRQGDLDGDWGELALAEEETVLQVAAEWSVDPSTLDERPDVSADGLLGYSR